MGGTGADVSGDREGLLLGPSWLLDDGRRSVVVDALGMGSWDDCNDVELSTRLLRLSTCWANLS